MDIQRLRYFASVARHLSFTKAAQECFIAQTAMSRHIAAMEQELGVQLFFRSNRSVLLTPAGESFNRDAVELVRQYDEAVERSRSIYKGYSNTIRIGFGQQERPLVVRAVRAFKALHPSVEVLFKQYSYLAMTDNLVNNQADVMFLLRFRLAGMEQVEVKALVQNALRVVVSKNHPLAGKKQITPESLSGQTVISATAFKAPGSLESVLEICREQGFEPGEIIQASSNEAKMLMLETGEGIAFLPYFLKETIEPNLVFLDLCRPFRDPGHSQDYVAAILCGNRNPVVRQFFNMLDTLDFSWEQLSADSGSSR